MRGFPRIINTKQDVQNLIGDYPDQAKAYLQGCLDNRKAFFPVRELDPEETIEETAEIRVVKQEGGGRILEELRDDPGAALYRLGFDTAEAETLIAGGE